MIRKLLTTHALIVTMLLGLLPTFSTAALADEATEWSTSDALPSSEGSYKLTTDVTISSTWTVPSGETTLDLNNHSITMTGSGSVIEVTFGTLTINETATNKTRHYYTPKTNDVASLSDIETEYYFDGGYITGCSDATDSRGGGIRVNGTNATVIMNGGTIFANRGGWGAGVYTGPVGGSSATFTLAGDAAIIGNYGGLATWSSGGGVFCEGGNFIMTGGKICHNATASGDGGGIRVNIQASDCYFTMTGGEISGNYAEGNGDGLGLDQANAFRISGNAVIKNNNTDNVYLRDGEKIIVIGELTSESGAIGVTMEKNTGEFTESTETSYNVANKFFCDNNTYSVLKNSSGQLEIGIQNNVASVTTSDNTTTEYETLAKALEAWVDGSTLKLLKDVETASTINIPNGTYTLDLNGCGLRAIGTGYNIITVSYGASLTLADSRPTATTHYFSVESPTSNGAGLATDISDIDNGNQLSFQGGYITGANNSGPGGAIVVAEYGYLSINGGTLIGNLTNEQGAGLYVYHNQSKDPTVRLTMTGGAVIYNKTTGNKGWGGGINVGGKIVMSGGIVAHNVSSMDKGGIHCHYIDMSGGSIVDNFAENSFSGGVHADCGVTLSGSPVITGNTANGVVHNLDWDVYNEFPTLSVTGELTCPDNSIGITMATSGVFTNSENVELNDLSKFFSDNEDYTVRKTTEGQLELYAQPVASVTVEGTTKEYTNLADALAAWVDGSTLTLLKDIKTSSTIKVEDGTYTLDLNGYTIDGDQKGSVITINSGTLVLDDGSVDKTGIITGGNATNDGGGVAVNGGTFKMLGGIIEHNTAKNGAGVAVQNGATFEMLGGKVQYNESRENTGGVLLNNGANFTMSGGEIQSNIGPRYGGIGSDKAIVKFSGTPVVKNNTLKDETPCDVRNTTNAAGMIEIVGKLESGAQIGVYNYMGDNAITAGYNTHNADNEATAFFFSNDESMSIKKNSDGELVFDLPPVASVTAEGTTIEYTTLTEALEAWVDGSTLTLLKDVTTTSTIIVPSGTYTLNLNGRGILMTKSVPVIRVPNGATLTIDDRNTIDHYITLSDYRAVSVSKSGTETTPINGTGVVKVTSGYIAGGINNNYGGGILVENGSLYMTGGTVIGNLCSTAGAGISNDNGTTSLSGNTQVIYNKSTSWGGAIYNGHDDATLSISDNVIVMYNCGKSGIHLCDNPLKLSGSPKILDNTVLSGGTGKGIRAEYMLDIVGPLNDAKISVCLNNVGDGAISREGQLTLPSEYIDANTAAQFVCENDGESGFTIVRKGQELWVTTGYSVYYHANGGEGTTLDENNPHEKNATATILANAFTAPEGKQFVDWNTEADGTGVSYEAGDMFEVVGNLTLYAQWEIAKYTLTVSANNDELGSVEVNTAGVIDNQDGTYTVEYGTEVTIKATPADGFHLASWSNGAEVNEDGTQKIKVTEDINIVANFSSSIAIAMDTDHKAEAANSEVQNGFEIYTYGYCNDNSYRLKYYLRSGEPDQYKVEFDDNRFFDVDWTELATVGPEGTIDLDIPADIPTGDYNMKVTFRNSNYTAFESEPIEVSFHVNLPETYTVPLYDNVIALVNTCECFTDVQWYHRDNSNADWQAISGATGYYYRQVGGLTGEYFVSAKMNGVSTYTCPQTDVKTLYGAPKKVAKVRVSPNPIENNATVSIEDSENIEHDLRIINVMGNVIEVRTFNGNSTSIDMGAYPTGTYMINVDGIGVKVIRK